MKNTIGLVMFTMFCAPLYMSASNLSTTRLLAVGSIVASNYSEFKDDVTTGAPWLLLFKKIGIKNQVGLKEVDLIVVKDDYGTSISYSGADDIKESPIIFLKSVAGVKVGAITTVAVDRELIGAEFTEYWSLGEKNYKFTGIIDKEYSAEDKLHGEMIGTHCRYELELHGHRWLLGRQWIDGHGTIPNPKVIWAGDMNEDNKIDLILLSGNEHNSQFELYLSQPANIFPKAVAHIWLG